MMEWAALNVEDEIVLRAVRMSLRGIRESNMGKDSLFPAEEVLETLGTFLERRTSESEKDLERNLQILEGRLQCSKVCQKHSGS